jgi:hypothetical protein
MPSAPTPVLPKLARAVRNLMGGGPAIALGLSRRTAGRIFAMMQAQQQAERVAELARKQASA